MFIIDISIEQNTMNKIILFFILFLWNLKFVGKNVYKKKKTVSARQGAQYLAAASHFATQSKLDDFVFPCLFARRMKAYR